MPPLVTTLSPFLSAAINWANFLRWRCAGIIIRKYMIPNSRTIRIMNWKEPPGAVACATRGASIEGAGDINSQPPDSREFRDDFISATRCRKPELRRSRLACLRVKRWVSRPIPHRIRTLCLQGEPEGQNRIRGDSQNG